MKNCNYCGRANIDEATHCTGCGTSDFVTSDSQAVTSRTEKKRVVESDDLVRDRPKFIIVVGIWTIYGLGLVMSILVLSALHSRATGGIFGFAYFGRTIAGGAICTYMLYRVVKNYMIHKKLDEIEKSAESNEETHPMNGKVWKCPSCGEKLAQQFDSCWKCGAKKDITSRT
jgi:hypothetical protein